MCYTYISSKIQPIYNYEKGNFIMANMTIKLTISESTKKALKASANVKEVTNAVVRYMDYFMGLIPWKAFKEHAKMRFAPQAFIEKTPLLAEAVVPVEVIEPLYQDLAANYAAMHPNCWLNDDQHEFSQSLVEAVAGDRTVLKKIQDTVGNAYATGFDIEHLKTLLTSKESNFRFGGLRKLGFTKKESEVLLNVAKEIFEYVEENFTVRPAVEEAVAIGEATPELPEAETVTAVEATCEPETAEEGKLDIEQLLYAEAKTFKREQLEEKLKTAHLIALALVSQIEDIAREAGVAYK